VGLCTGFALFAYVQELVYALDDGVNYSHDSKHSMRHYTSIVTPFLLFPPLLSAMQNYTHHTFAEKIKHSLKRAADRRENRSDSTFLFLGIASVLSERSDLLRQVITIFYSDKNACRKHIISRRVLMF
jgi:hypothetical protein